MIVGNLGNNSGVSSFEYKIRPGSAIFNPGESLKKPIDPNVDNERSLQSKDYSSQMTSIRHFIDDEAMQLVLEKVVDLNPHMKDNQQRYQGIFEGAGIHLVSDFLAMDSDNLLKLDVE